MSLLDRLRGERAISTIDDYAALFNTFSFNGLNYGFGLSGSGIQQTLGGQSTEMAPNNFVGLASHAYASNGPVFACMMVRQLVFSSIRFTWQRMRQGKPSDTFGNSDLGLLERPWPGGTTQDLLSRIIQDADLAGNSYWMREGGELVRMRPDWVHVVVEPRELRDGRGQIGWRKVGYIYLPTGSENGDDAVGLLADEVVHFAPIPDPLASYRGMSWLTPILREIQADQAMSKHQSKFFDNAATVNMIIKHSPLADPDAVKKWADEMQSKHGGANNAWKNLNLYPGADATPVGSNLKDIDFKEVRGGGEPLALDTPIPTPSGWTTMGDIGVGDEIFGRDGLPALVTSTSPIHHGRECYRVTFTDRTSIVADAGHLWTAMNRSTNARAENTFTTGQIAELVAEWDKRGSGGNRFGIPPAAPVKLPDRDLLVDPYVLGVWLGDGQTAGAAVCGAPDDLAFIGGEIRRCGYSVTEWVTTPGKASVIGLPGGFLAALDALGVLGNKHIPAEFLRSSESQRLELLRGLMDTDGTVGHAGHETCEFSSKYESLAQQVAELTRSLGHRTTVSCKVEPRSRTGETWRVTFRADPEMIPFRMPRKVQRCITPKTVRNRAIVSVEPVGSVPVRCIAVDTPDHLFIAGEGWTLTHNTRIAAAAGVPPVIVGLSEGLAAATYSNYGQARRRLADGTAHPLWQNIAGSMEQIMTRPGSDVRLWYDATDVPFLREDEKDAADIAAVRAATINTYITAGYEPDSVVLAVESNDLGLLKHTGLNSVQLLPPGQSKASESMPATNGQAQGGVLNGAGN